MARRFSARELRVRAAQVPGAEIGVVEEDLRAGRLRIAERESLEGADPVGGTRRVREDDGVPVVVDAHPRR